MNLLLLATLVALPVRADVLAEVRRAADRTLEEAERLEAFEAAVDQGHDPAVASLARDPSADPRERWVAVRVLGRVHSPPSVEALVALLDDPVPAIRAAAASAAGDSGRPDLGEPVADLLEDPAVLVRTAAADALALLGQPQTVPALVRALDDPTNTYRGQSLWVRRHLVAALGAIGDRSAVPALIRSLDDADPLVASAACRALERVTGLSWADGRSEAQEREAWKRWWGSQK
ncbi:MAG: HEAT repeat domain-containing protein [Deltaproteobacteria bacterium]|nr:HEAT repeat domain-containing protein [Deltaproteobacteria bacterium]